MSSLFRRPQQGFAIIAAIFLLVVLAGLGAFMLSFSNTQHLTSAQDVQGARAYWAARAGVEWGITSATNGCFASPTALVIDAFTVTVSCTLAQYTDADAISVFNIVAVSNPTGVAVGGVGYVERSVSASVCRLQAAPFGFC